MRHRLAAFVLYLLGASAPSLGSEVKEISTSHIILALGPEYSSDEEVDFEVNFGSLNPFYYRYEGTQPYSACVLKSAEFSFGSSTTRSLRIGARINAKIYWRGNTQEFLQDSAFLLRLEGETLKNSVRSPVRMERKLSLSSLPHRQAQSGEDQYVASTHNKWEWFVFNPFELSAELDKARIHICQVSGAQNLYISEMELELSHEVED
jgi:hypothetical protein